MLSFLFFAIYSSFFLLLGPLLVIKEVLLRILISSDGIKVEIVFKLFGWKRRLFIFLIFE